MAVEYIAPNGQWRTVMFSCNRFISLTSYAEAKRWHDDTIPMRRGYHKGKRPIHHRDRAYWHIVDTGERIEFRENDRTIVAWLPNGEIHVKPLMFNCCYEQLTSLLGILFFRKDNRLWVNTHRTMALHCNEVNIFKRDSSGHLQLTNPPSRTKKVVNKTEANKIRKLYKPFIDYVRTTYKVRDEGYSIQECVEAFGRSEHHTHTSMAWYSVQWPVRPDPDMLKMRRGHVDFDKTNEQFVKAIQNPDAFYIASLVLMNCARDTYFSSDRTKPSLNKMLKILTNIIYYYHRDEVFVDKELDASDMSRDTYAHFFK